MKEESVNRFINNRYCLLVMGLMAAVLSYFFHVSGIGHAPGGAGIWNTGIAGCSLWAVNALTVLAVAVMMRVLDKNFAFVREYTVIYAAYFLFSSLCNPSYSVGFPRAAAVNAVLPLLAPNGRLAMANGLRGFLSSIVMLLSPAAAGLLFPLDGGLELSLALDISTALAAMAALSLQAIPDIRGEGRVDMKGAARYVKSDRYLLFLLVFNAAASFAISPGAFMTPLLLQREYWASPSMLSVSEMSYSIGMVAGGCIATIAGESMRQRRGYASALMAYGICLVLIGLVHSFPLYLLLNALIGISTPIYGALLNARVQERTEEGMLGRVMALLSASSSAALPLGMVLFGPLGDAIPIRSVFALSGAAAAFLSVLGLRRA